MLGIMHWGGRGPNVQLLDWHPRKLVRRWWRRELSSGVDDVLGAWGVGRGRHSRRVGRWAWTTFNKSPTTTAGELWDA